MLGERARASERARERSEWRRGRWREGALDRRTWAALAAILGAVLAMSSRSVRLDSPASPARDVGSIGGAEGAARGGRNEGVGLGVGGAREGLDARDEGASAREFSNAGGSGIDLDDLNDRLLGSAWDFNEPMPRRGDAPEGSGSRAARPLPSLGQSSSRSSVSKDVAEGESRAADGKGRTVSKEFKAGTSQPGLALSDDEIYDPAFVDDEFENGRRSGKEYLKRFLDPPLLNTTWNTGRVRRLGRTLYLDGKPWLMRAICYSPVPVGWDPDWFEPYGDFFTNEYAGIFERDIPLMAAAGVNTLRIYTLSLSRRHKQFFDLAHQHNMTILVGYDFEDGTKSLFNTAETMAKTQNALRTLVRSAKHPAVIGWIVGNELNGPWNLYVCDSDLAESFGVSGCQFEDSIEKLMKSLNLLCGVVRSENMLCGTAIANVNLPKKKQHLVGTQLWGALSWIKLADRYMDQLDFWGVNLYTRRYFSPMGIFQRYHLVSKRPFLITEFGVDAFSLNPQLEGLNGYDTMGTEDQVSQADWLGTMVEDIERHATTCKSGCGVRFTSGGAIMAWVDEYWKGKAVTPVPTNDERIPTITRVCPSLKEYLHSPCGYMSPTQPDLYVSEEWFGIMAVEKKCSINKVDLLRPRAAYFMLKMLWKDGGACTVFHGQDKVAYDTDMYPDCSKAMKAYHNKTMHLFMRAEAEAFHEIKLSPNEPAPIFAHFENFSAILTHPKGVINPVSTSLQSTFLTCHHMRQINRKSDKTCPQAPEFFNDIERLVNDQIAKFEQPGDTSCPDSEQIDVLKLEVEFLTIIKFFFAVYFGTAFAIRWRLFRRHARDALISLSRSKFFIVSLFMGEDRAFAEIQKRAEQLVNSPPKKSRQLEGELSSESSEKGDEEPSWIRPGPEPTGTSAIEREIDQWRTRISPAVESLVDLFGFQRGSGDVGSTGENCIDKCATLLWNTSQLEGAPSASLDWAVATLHRKTFATYNKYLNHTGIDFAPRGTSTLASTMKNGNTDAKLCQIVLFELIYIETANMRFMPEFLAFIFHIMAASVDNRGLMCTATAESGGLRYEAKDFLTSIVTPMYDFLTSHMKSAAPLHLRLGYDDINEAFLDVTKIRMMLDEAAPQGASSYARFRQFMRTAGSAKENDRNLSRVFKKTHREHLGWMTAYINFQRMFLLLMLMFHGMVVHAFYGFTQPLMYSTMSITTAFFDVMIELRTVLFDRAELYHSRLESIGRAAFGLAVMLAGLAFSLNFLDLAPFAVISSPQVVLGLMKIAGYEITAGNKADEYFTKQVGRSASTEHRRKYTAFWLVTFALKLPLDYLLMIRPLVVPTRAILSIDLYCWNYNFAGVDCDAIEYTEMFSPKMVEIIRLMRRYGFRSLMLVERWAPNLLLYLGNTFFYFVTVIGVGAAIQSYKSSIIGGWAPNVLALPRAIEIFSQKILIKPQKAQPQPDPSTALCSEAVSESWQMFSRAWNEIINSLRSRDLLSNEERDLMLFQTLRGRTSESFFGSRYVVFPVMLTGSIYSGIGLQRNEKMRFGFATSVMAQMIDLLAFVMICILGIVDPSDRVYFVELVKSVTELMSLAISEHSRSIPWLDRLRGHFVGLLQSMQNANMAGIRGRIESILQLITDDVAKDRVNENATHRQTNALLVQTCGKLKGILRLEKLEPSLKSITAAIASPAGSKVVKQLQLMMSTSNPAGEPASHEAKDVVRFFLQSLTGDSMPKAMTVRQMPMLTTLTPVYGEEIRTSLDTLTAAIDGESVTGFRFMVSMAQSSWENMLERTRVKVKDSNYEHFFDRALLERNTAWSTFTDDEKYFTEESIKWASLEGQTLYRTVVGFAGYIDALRMFARLEGVSEADIEPLVRAKFEHVVTAQLYRAPGYTMNSEIEAIVETFPHVKVNYVVQPAADDPNYAIARIERGTDGKCKQTHLIQIPGHPIVGEGKPENQNMGLVWTRGMYIQTIDMNQDASLAEAMKVRNLLSMYQLDEQLVVVGFHERLISGRQGSVSSFAATSETVFGTMLQRFMATPLRVRLHYGHPDMWDGAFVRSSGGVSKASKRLHLSEDVYGGMNVLQRGGSIEHVAFISCGKGREVSFDGNNQFNKKIATGNGMQLISRDFHRLAKSMDIFRSMSFFQSSVGLFYTEFLLFASMISFVLCKTMIAMYSIETYFKEGDAFDNIGFHQEIGLETLYPSQWMLQASLVMAWPGMLYGWLNGGLVEMIKDTYQGMMSGSFIYHMFIAKSRGYAIDASITSGDAMYRGTKRSMSMNASFSDLYMQYGASHILPSVSIIALTILLTELSYFNALYVFITTTWHVWIAATLWMLSPWFFHPQTFKEGSPAINFTSWLFWLDNPRATHHGKTLKDGTWWAWHAKQMRAKRAMPRHLKVEYIIFRILPIPCLLMLSSMVTIRADDLSAGPPLRGVVTLTSGVAGILLTGVYYMSTSPLFLWPQRVVTICERLRIVRNEVGKRLAVLVYNMTIRMSLIVFHLQLCGHLFRETVDVEIRQNKVIFALCALCAIYTFAAISSLIGDNPVFYLRNVAFALRSISDFCHRDVDEVVGLALHVLIATLSLAPISYVHAKTLFNRAFASVLALEMRRRALVVSMNRAISSKSLRSWFLSSRSFIRKVLGLKTAPLRATKLAPSTLPDLMTELTRVGKLSASNERVNEIKRRIEPIASNLADIFGFQKSAKDATFTSDEVEVPSNLWNSIESLSRWLENLLTERVDVTSYSIDHLDRYWAEVVNELHSHLFQNYNRWGAYTGMVDAVSAHARRAALNADGSAELLLSLYMSDANELWTRSSRETTAAIELNAKIHHLCLWFLIYGESANLRHMSECLCFIFHAALCAVKLDGRAPSESEKFVLCRPVADSVMPYEAKDFLRKIVTPIFLFLKREISDRSANPISERVMYDDVNEFFWQYDRLVRLLPPEKEPARTADETDFIGVPAEMAELSRDERMYEHLRSVLGRALSSGNPADVLEKVFFKTHREVSGWLSMFVNFQSIILFHAVAFHISTAYVFAHGWNWSSISTSVLTHSILKFIAEIAVLRFINLSQERFGDWMVTVTRASMFVTMPLFYLLERSIRRDGATPYFEGLAAVYAIANSGLMSSVLRRAPFVGSPTQMATPIRDRIIYTLFWLVVLATKLAFGHFLLITPLREAVSALQKGDLCWNKESDEYTSCINLEGDALVQALKFKPKTTYFADVKKDEDDYEDGDFQLAYYEPLPERRRSLLSSRAGGGDFTGALWGDKSDFADEHETNESADPYNGQYRGWSSIAASPTMPRSPLESAISGLADAASNAIHSAIGGKQLRLPALGYIGEEIEGQLPEAYYDVHASQFLMSVLVVARMLPAVATYFCDTFLWYTCYASLFTIFLQWRGKVSHAQRWSRFIRDFRQIPAMFCGKIMNREWPRPVAVAADMSDGTSDGGVETFRDIEARQRSGGGYGKELNDELLDSVALAVVDDEVIVDSDVSVLASQPSDFLPEAMDIKWQFFARGWNSIVDSLRERDQITNKECADLKFVLLQGRDVEQIFDAPEYIVLAPMLTSSVFSAVNFRAGSIDQYPWFASTLIQTKDLLCVILTEVLRVVSPGDLSLLMRVVSDLAELEGEQMGQRRYGDYDAYIQLRDAVVKLLLTLQAMGASTDATPIVEDQSQDADEAVDSESEDEEAQLLLLGDTAGAERARLRKEQRRKARQLREIREKEKHRQRQVVEAINLEMKFGCTGIIPKETRRKMKGGKSGLLRGCFVVQENWEELTEEQRVLLEESDERPTSRRRWRRGPRKLIKWSNIQTDADIEAQSRTLAEALHEILLAVRSICSFVMESDGRWSNSSNQRKYRVAQLYSQLLEMVRIDALRDSEHVRVVSASATLATNRTIVECLLNSMNNINPGGEPRSPEARRQLMFFANSLNFTSLKMPTRLRNMRAWTAFTPYYAEEVSYSKEELVKPLEDQKTLFSVIRATYPDEYENFKERIGALACDDAHIMEEHWEELRIWTSDRTQSLSRCVRGICQYGTALRFLARAEGYSEDEIEMLVQDKFEYLVSCQVYGSMLVAPEGSVDRRKARDIDELIMSHPELKVCFVQVPSARNSGFASCLIGCDRETQSLNIVCKVELPGNPIIGEGKPENQNHAVIFSRGPYLQTLDMNQDGYFPEALKMRNLLDVFSEDVVLVGFPEVIFSETTGAVAQFAAIAEFIFQTFQRFMTWPLMVRFHYGHPDVWDKAFTMTNGGVSKASKVLHVAEDFFGGVNAIVRGGRVLFEEFIEVGKGRDMGFTSVNGFEQKISGSAGTISMSRDVFRLHRSMDFFRIMSMYFSGPGFFISVMQTAWCVYLYILVHAGLAIADLEIYRIYRYFKITEAQTTLSLSKEEGGYYNSIYAIQLGLLSVLPLFLKMIMDRGLRDGVEYTASSLLRGSWAFNIFAMTTKGYNYMIGLIFGKAQYIATERGFVLQNANMVVLYGLYAKSHLYAGMEVLALLLLFHCNTVLPKSILYSWSVWSFALCVLMTPWWFSPQSTNSYWMQQSWMDWRSWLDGTFDKPKVANGSWKAWHNSMIDNYRNRIGFFNKTGVLLMSSFGRIILALVVTGSLHGTALYTGTTQIEQFYINVSRMGMATGIAAFVAFLYSYSLNSVVFDREPWLQFPDKLWKISVYRGCARLGLFLIWNGLYFFVLHVDSGSNSVRRTWFMTGLGSIAIIAICIEACVLLSDRSLTTFGERWLPIKTVDGEPEPRGNQVRRMVSPIVFGIRHGLVVARSFADFWYKELDKLMGVLIFSMISVLSLLPVATMQTALIWNETFSDILAKRIAVQDTVSSILD